MDTTLLTSVPKRTLTLILGGPGSGKTTSVIDQLAQEVAGYRGWKAIDKPWHALVVPEQQALLLEHELAQRLRAGGQALTSRGGVFTFGQLGRLLGCGAAELSDAHLLSELMQSSRGKHRLAHCERALPVLRELLTDGVSPVELQRLEEVVRTDAGNRELADRLCNLHEHYSGLFAACNARPVPTGFMVSGQVWLDGFAGFTALEYRVLDQLFQSGLCSIACTLLLDETEVGREEYLVPRRTKARLVQLAEQHGWKVRAVNLSSTGHPKASVTTVECANRLAEADFVARQIVGLTRSPASGGRVLRFGAISVAVPSLALYRDLLLVKFGQYGIPAYIDERSRLVEHGLVAWFKSALALSLEVNLPGVAHLSDIHCYLQFPWKEFPLQDTAIWELQRHARRKGMTAQQWLSNVKWQGTPELAAWQEQLFAPVLQIASRVQGATLPAWLASAWECLLAQRELSEPHLPAAEVLAELIAEMGSVTFDQRIQACPGDGTEEAELTAGEAMWCANQLLDQLTLGHTPSRQDAVLVTDLLRGRHATPEVTFLLGMDEANWPLPPPTCQLFTDAEREELAALWRKCTADSVPWQPLRRHNSDFCDMRPYLAMVAETRPSRVLFALRPLSDRGSEVLLPSTHFSAIASRADQALTHGPADSTALSQCRSEADLRLASALRQPRTETEWGRMPTLRERLARRDGVLRLSPTQLETMAACPAKHFIRYGLRLNEDSADSFGRRELGTAYHGLLQGLGRTLAGMDNVDHSLVRSQVQLLLETHLAELSTQSGRQRASYVGRRLELLIGERVDWLQLEADDEFRIVDVEVDLERNTLGLRPFSISTPSGAAAIGGRIDRLDRNRQGKHRLVDYKLTKASFDWRRFAAGLQQQLLIYLLAVVQSDAALEMSPAGAWLQPLEPQRTGEQFTLQPTALGRAHYGLAQGVRARLADGTLLAWAMRAAEHIARELCEWIDEGWIAPQPLADRDWSACASCDYRAICRFDSSSHLERPVADLNVRALLNGIAAGTASVTPLPPRPVLIQKEDTHG